MTVATDQLASTADRLLALIARELDALFADDEADYALSERIVARALADEAGNFRRCPQPACRRARRCMGEAMPCAGHRRHVVPQAEEKRLIEDVYVRLQAVRA
ncbi:MAG: hypothetical protein IT538_12800 [Variibacter sp.]|nr:hypothetical protein [Variibacter sp.]